MATPIPILKARFFDSDGNPLAGGKLYSYLAGTNVPLTTYADAAEETPNQNPVVLDADGYADVYLGNANYKFVLADANDVIQFTVGDVSGSSGGGGSVESPWTEHEVADGQSATSLTGETIDLSLYSSGVYQAEIIRGTTIIASGQVYVESVNGTGRVRVGVFTENAGVTFTLSQVGTVVTLRAAASSGPGNGTIKLSRRLVPV